MGIEPTSSAWKAEVLPLNYTRTLVCYFLIFCLRTVMPLPLPAYSVKWYLSRQLEDYSVDALLVAEVLPLNYTRALLEKFVLFFMYSL